MKKQFNSTIDESVEVHYRIAEIMGTVKKVRSVGWWMAVLIFFLVLAFTDHPALKWWLSGGCTLVFLIYYLLTYKKELRKRLRMTLVKTIGTAEPVPCEYEMNEQGVVFRKQEQEVRLPWSGVESISETDDYIEIVFKPTGITHIPMKIFDSEQEQDEWIQFIREHASVDRKK